MKKILSVLFLSLLINEVNAELFTLKIGGNYYADYTFHKAGKISYPGFDISIEKALSKKISISGIYSYSIRDYRTENDFSIGGPVYFGNYRWKDIDQSVILEGRFYINNYNNGVFIMTGIPFTYTTEKSYNNFSTLRPENNSYFYSISIYGGMGIKYSLSSRLGIEMNMSISPSLNFLDVDYGTSGFIKSGIKLNFSL